jgi:hypothetical protein
VMDLIWSYWSRPAGPAHQARWKTAFHNLLSWAMSVSMPGASGARKILYTDSPGARLLIDGMKLPFDEVDCSLDTLPEQEGRLWVLGKLTAYRQHSRPFAHIDNDVFLWRRLPARVEGAGLFAQNPERFSPSSPDYQPAALVAGLDESGVVVPEALRWYAQIGGNDAYCCGIVGGQRVDLLNDYADRALALAKHQGPLAKLASHIELNVLLEQYFLSAYCFHQIAVAGDTSLRIEHLFDSEFASQLASESRRVGYTHLIGPAKQDDFLLAKVERYVATRLPDYHARAAKLAEALDHGKLC